MTIPCWIISLNPAAPTASALSQALTTQGVAHNFLPAVDGRKSTPALIDNEQLDTRNALTRHRKLLTNSELGCYLSHYRAVKAAFTQGLERICILEDDVALEPDFANILHTLESQPEAVEMIRLMALRIRKRKIVATLPDGKHQLVRPERGWCGAQGYVLTRSGMKKIIDHGWRIFEPIDKLYDHFWEFDLKLYGVEPHLIYETEHVTSIQKAPETPTKIPLHYSIAAPILKGLFSLSRSRYLTAHQDEFYPAEAPKTSVGKTRRLR